MLEAPNYDIVRTIGSGAFGIIEIIKGTYSKQSIGRQNKELR
jgi:hypothetical protein